jgi:pimeloyl-ACP methyl ester carboxylesterase
VEQVVLYTDESGVSRWIFPEKANGQTDRATRGGGGEVTFHLPRQSAPTPPTTTDEQAARGPISKLGRRLVRILAWATDDIVGQGALAVATRWENARRPYALRPFPFVDEEAQVAWDTVRRGRALLLIHGTFSSARSAFADLPQTTIDQLSHLYGDRIIAFDHPSLSHSTQQNAQTLLDRLPSGIELNIDILTHSRGGLVGRELTERFADLNRGGRQLKVHNAIFVAAPNRGTILTDGDHGVEMIDRYTNLLTSLPDNAYTLTMEGVLMVVKLLLHGALKGLPGLQNMYPQGEYLRRLNSSPAHDTQYYALAANFIPSAPGLLSRFGKRVADKFIDGVFGEDNDGVVPTLGSYECEPDSPGFPVLPERRIVFEKDDQIHHCNFFQSERLNGQIIEWLSNLAARI